MQRKGVKVGAAEQTTTPWQVSQIDDTHNKQLPPLPEKKPHRTRPGLLLRKPSPRKRKDPSSWRIRKLVGIFPSTWSVRLDSGKVKLVTERMYLTWGTEKKSMTIRTYVHSSHKEARIIRSTRLTEQQKNSTSIAYAQQVASNFPIY